jgi:hypothetical protein
VIAWIVAMAGCTSENQLRLQDADAAVSLLAGCTAVETNSSTPLVEGVEAIGTSVTTTSWDDAGARIRVVHDEADDRDDVVETWDRRPDGQFTVHRTDLGADGVLDRIETVGFGDDDQADRMDVDSDGDGTIDARATYGYDDLGRHVALDTDERLDGTTDLTWRATWEGDSDRPLTRDAVDLGRRYVSLQTFAYDGADRLVADRYELETDVYVLQLDWTYDYEGDGPNPIGAELWQTVDTTSQFSAITMRYDALGRQTEWRQQRSLDGDESSFEVEALHETTWVCP